MEVLMLQYVFLLSFVFSLSQCLASSRTWPDCSAGCSTQLWPCTLSVNYRSTSVWLHSQQVPSTVTVRGGRTEPHSSPHYLLRAHLCWYVPPPVSGVKYWLLGPSTKLNILFRLFIPSKEIRDQAQKVFLATIHFNKLQWHWKFTVSIFGMFLPLVFTAGISAQNISCKSKTTLRYRVMVSWWGRRVCHFVSCLYAFV